MDFWANGRAVRSTRYLLPSLSRHVLIFAHQILQDSAVKKARSPDWCSPFVTHFSNKTPKCANEAALYLDTSNYFKSLMIKMVLKNRSGAIHREYLKLIGKKKECLTNVLTLGKALSPRYIRPENFVEILSTAL
jgi:hypothetical protein